MRPPIPDYDTNKYHHMFKGRIQFSMSSITVINKNINSCTCAQSMIKKPTIGDTTNTKFYWVFKNVISLSYQDLKFIEMEWIRFGFVQNSGSFDAYLYTIIFWLQPQLTRSATNTLLLRPCYSRIALKTNKFNQNKRNGIYL